MIKSKKQIIYEVAAKLFKEKGYPVTSMRDLAAAVGLKKASGLYSHIGSKEELLQNICLNNAKHYLKGMKSIESLIASPTKKTRLLIDFHIKTAIENPTSVTVFNDEWQHLSEPFLADFLEMRRDYEKRFFSIIVEGIERKEFKSINPTLALYTILSSIKWVHYWYRPDRSISVQQLTDNIIALLLTGIEKNLR